MTHTRIRSAVLLTLSLFAFALACAAQETLADFARRSRPAVHTAKRVFTSDDVRTVPEPQPAPAKADDAKLDLAAGEAATADDPDNRDGKSADGSKVSDPIVRGEIQRIQKAEAALEQKLATLKEKLATEQDEFRRRMWADALDNQRITLEQYKKLREQLERTEQKDAKTGA